MFGVIVPTCAIQLPLFSRLSNWHGPELATNRKLNRKLNMI